MTTLTMRVSKARTLKFAGAFVVLCAAMFLVASPAWANTIVVNSTEDTSTNDGECTLREAIVNANIDAEFANRLPGECDPGSGEDEITFELPDGEGGITLGGTQLRINSNLAITGPGADRLTVSGNNASRVFEVTSASTAG
ncbi:MAG: CSLREA domain-containing protein [Rubrobacteraceae bacterium]